MNKYREIEREANRYETVKCGEKVSQVIAVDRDCIETRDGWMACHGDYVVLIPEADGLVRIKGGIHTVSDVYDDGSIEIMERFVVRPGEYEIVDDEPTLKQLTEECKGKSPHEEHFAKPMGREFL